MKNDYMSRENTTSVNGLFILLVFLNHIQSYVTLPEGFHRLTLAFGQLMVAMFLFYSGYGVTESIKKKGQEYVKSIPVFRAGKVLLMFSVSVLIYTLLDVVLHISFTPRQFLLSLIGWESMGNSNWYIFVVLCLYLISWISFSCRNRRISVLLMGILSLLLYLILREHKPSWWYNTIIAYPIGTYFSLGREWIRTKEDQKGVYPVLLISACLIVFLCKPYAAHGSVHSIMTAAFCIVVLAVTKKIPAYNPVFYWLGKHLFEIYILMRIPMIVLQPMVHSGITTLLYFLICFATTLLLAAGYHKFWAIVNFSSSRNGR